MRWVACFFGRAHHDDRPLLNTPFTQCSGQPRWWSTVSATRRQSPKTVLERAYRFETRADAYGVVGSRATSRRETSPASTRRSTSGPAGSRMRPSAGHGRHRARLQQHAQRDHGVRSLAKEACRATRLGRDLSKSWMRANAPRRSRVNSRLRATATDPAHSGPRRGVASTLRMVRLVGDASESLGVRRNRSGGWTLRSWADLGEPRHQRARRDVRRRAYRLRDHAFPSTAYHFAHAERARASSRCSS